jgi:hypothetical protein
MNQKLLIKQILIKVEEAMQPQKIIWELKKDKKLIKYTILILILTSVSFSILINVIFYFLFIN